MPKILGAVKSAAYCGLPKYTFFRHGGNNSAWTTNHRLLDTMTLREYLSVYRRRTGLCGKFLTEADASRYFETLNDGRDEFLGKSVYLGI
ncbi:hypothetical protein FACS1894216_18390 [Synergistales bacterium]|nr:hypothetical protein FACS1894216_18390 [Synergistales bacterium]